MLSVVCWKWGPLFGPEYVNRLRVGLERHLRLDHRLFCVTDDSRGIDPRVTIVPLPERHRDSPRCRRRMRIFDRVFCQMFFGPRILSLDLDVVLVDDITPIIDRSEPIVGWKVQHAGVYSGSFLLMDAGVLDPLWRQFDQDPEGLPKRAQPRGVGSDQAMFNWYLERRGMQIATWRERDGFVTYFGEGYEKFEHLGVGPRLTILPKGARIVVLGSGDKAVMDRGAYPWVRQHWTALEAVPA